MSRRAPQVQAARLRAAQVLQDYGMDHLPVDPMALARACDIHVEAKPPEYDGFSGMLARVGETFGILYATYVPSEGFQNFSVAHELGHYFLDGHVDQLLNAGPHVSRANFASADPCEVEADMFAAALLMPEGSFKRELTRHDEGLASVVTLAGLCKTSLTATAVSYARFTRGAVAIVQSTNGQVDFCLMSDALKDGMTAWLKRGESVPTSSPTGLIAGDAHRLKTAAQESADTLLNRWFANAPAFPVREEAIGLGRFGKVLTVLHCPRLGLASDGYDDDEETDEDVLERWTPRFR